MVLNITILLHSDASFTLINMYTESTKTSFTGSYVHTHTHIYKKH